MPLTSVHRTNILHSAMLANARSDVLSQLERFKESFLWAAAKGGRVEECESLVQMGTDVNWVSPEGDTPLLAACRNGHVATALFLLSHGASVNQAANDGRTALHLACRHGKEAVAEALILGGADVSVRDYSGATAFESHASNAPAGMLGRLTTVLQRAIGQSRFHQGVTMTDITTATTTSYGSASTQGGGSMSATQNDHPVLGADTLRTPISDRRLGNDDSSRSGWSNRSSAEHLQQQRRSDDADDGAGGVGAGNISPGGRGDNRRGTGDRTTFPSISRKVGSATGGRRQSPRIRIDRQGGSFTSGGQGFHSSDDDDDNELVCEDETRTRHLGGLYRGLDGRQLGTFPSRSRSQGNDDDFPGDMRLISTGHPVPRASAAIAAAIASASAATTPDTSRSTVATTTNTALSTMTVATLGAGAAPPLPISPRRSADDEGTAAAAWDGAGADGGGGHGVIFGNRSNSSSSGSGSGSSSGSGSRRGGGGSRGGGGVSARRNNAGGESPSNRAIASSSSPFSPAATASDTNTATATATTNVGAYGSLAAITTSETANGAFIGSTRLCPKTHRETRQLRGSRDEMWEEEVDGTFGSGAPLYAAADARAAMRSGRLSRTRRTEGEIRRSGGFGGDTPDEDASNDHIGLIRALWLQEKEGRLASEAKADAVREQGARLWNELVRSEKQVLRLEEGMAGLREERDKLKATLHGEGVKGRSLQELEQLEKDLRKALEGVCGERDRIVQDQLVKEEQRLCVVCQENERGVLLLPCRHLCVCKGCSERQELTLCPLCRDHIAESLVVYS